ncbi:MAG: large conductance mechanosensitive channel protein MscL, partial [Pseudomonadota bacterium]
WILFMIVKGMNNLKRTMEAEEEAAVEAPAGPTQEELLGEIRDLLAKA